MTDHIIEVAAITVTDPAGFEAGVIAACPHFLAAAGCLPDAQALAVEVVQQVQKPERVASHETAVHGIHWPGHLQSLSDTAVFRCVTGFGSPAIPAAG